MKGKLLFCHDHWFSLYEGDYYSPGKLDYGKFKFYLELFDSIEVIARFKNVNSISNNDIIANGHNVHINGVENLSSLMSFFHKKSIEKIIEQKIDECEFIIVRVPSEIGNLAAKIAKKKNKSYFVEVVARAYDALFFQDSFLAKMYSPIMELKTKKVVRDASYSLYVTSDYLQKFYPSYGFLSEGISDVSIPYISSEKKYSDSSTYNIGMIGSPDVAIKGVADAISAIEIARNEGLSINFHVLGNYSKFIKNKNLPEWVHLDGSLPSNQVFQWLDNLDLYIQPSYAEGLPRALIEAMSRGLPCIASNVGGIPELLPDEFLIQPGDINNLKNLIAKLLNNAQYYHHASELVLESANKYTGSILNQRRMKFYQSCLNHFRLQLMQ